MKRDIAWGAAFGFMCAVWMTASPWSDSTKYKEVIKQCESTLPRNQHCKVIGVPE